MTEMGRCHAPTVGVVVVTHRARQHLVRCLSPLLRSPLRPRVLVTNSSSDDGTVELAHSLGAETLVIPRREFNHGRTRDRARHYIATDIVVMMTPDAYPVGEAFLETLVRPLIAGEAAVAYARQLPRDGAGAIERCGRRFNYPPSSQLRSREDRNLYGNYLHFCSNACAAWSNAALDAIGGFGTTLVSEETIASARLLARGERIAYVAEAVVLHSHDYGLGDEFRRHFDVGWTRARHADLLLHAERDEVRGRRFARALLATVGRECPWLLPQACAVLAARYFGYRTGLSGARLPAALAAWFSGQDYYWTSTAHDAAAGPA